MKKILCGGCFNKIHKGHVYFLKQCKSLGKLNVVVSNDVINRHKYKEQAVSAETRKKNIEKLKIADKVVIGNKDNRLKTVRDIQPDIICLGYDQKLEKNILEHCKKNKIKLKRIHKLSL